MSRISTVSGGSFDVLNPCAEDVNLEDIAHALAMNCRYNGHTNQFYSVAEHSVIMSQQGDPEHALALLIHDAAEAYLTDIPRPVKEMFPAFSTHEMGVLMVILEALELPSIDVNGWAAIAEADLRMLATERPQLLPKVTDSWPCLHGVTGYDVKLPCWNPEKAKAEFLKRYCELTNSVMAIC